MKKILYVLSLAILVIIIPQFSIAGDKVICSGHPNYPPIMWNQDGKLIGVGPELVKTVLEELGLEAELKAVDSWKRVQECTRIGEIDLIVGAYSNVDRRSYMAYTKPYFQDHTNIFVRKDHPFSFESRDDLIGRKGVAIYGESYGQDLDQFIIDRLNITRVYDAPALFENLESGRVDYIIWGYYPWMINCFASEAQKWCVVLGNPVVSEGMYIGISRKSIYTDLVPGINQIIERLKNDGTIERWFQKYIAIYRNKNK